MNDPDGTVRPRRTVYEVEVGSQKQNVKRRHTNVIRRQNVQQKLTAHVNEQVPLELTPLVQAALDYGRRTHAIGALKAAQVLSNVALKLKSLKINDQCVDDLIIEAETESKRITSMFNGTGERAAID